MIFVRYAGFSWSYPEKQPKLSSNDSTVWSFSRYLLLSWVLRGSFGRLPRRFYRSHQYSSDLANRLHSHRRPFELLFPFFEESPFSSYSVGLHPLSLIFQRTSLSSGDQFYPALSSPFVKPSSLWKISYGWLHRLLAFSLWKLYLSFSRVSPLIGTLSDLSSDLSIVPHFVLWLCCPYRFGYFVASSQKFWSSFPLPFIFLLDYPPSTFPFFIRSQLVLTLLLFYLNSFSRLFSTFIPRHLGNIS